jgi:hypothetical protein
MLACQEIVLTHRAPLASFDLSDAQLAALDVALDAYRLATFAHRSLEVEDVLALATLRALTDQVAPLVAAGAHGTLRVDDDGLTTLGQAVVAYLQSRDVEGYQPPELRARLTLLDALTRELFDLAAELDAARARLGR